MYLLDTNVVSELRKPKPHGAVKAWFVPIPAELIFIPAVVLGEIQTGIEVTSKQDTKKALELTIWADWLVENGNMIPADAAIFRRRAQLMQGKSDDLWEDALIAATAVEMGMTIVSRNQHDFATLGFEVLNPFDSSD